MREKSTKHAQTYSFYCVSDEVIQVKGKLLGCQEHELFKKIFFSSAFGRQFLPAVMELVSHHRQTELGQLFTEFSEPGCVVCV